MGNIEDSVSEHRRHTTRSAERRGRGLRGQLLETKTPARLSRHTQFHREVNDIYSALRSVWPELTPTEVHTFRAPETTTQFHHVPHENVLTDESIVLARIYQPTITESGTMTDFGLVMYRAPIELRMRDFTESRGHRHLFLRDVTAQLCGKYLHMSGEDILRGPCID